METELSTMTLPELETIVDRGLETFVEVGGALLEIRDGKMYGNQYETFDEYCQGRFGFTKRRANQLIEATETVRLLGTIVPSELIPKTESQARALADVADTPAKQARVMKKAAKDAPKDTNGHPRITASAIKIAAGVLPTVAKAAAIMKAQKPPGREPGDESETEPKVFKNQRSKTIKTVEALMRAFDDLHGMQSNRLQHADAIASCKILLRTAKDWSCK